MVWGQPEVDNEQKILELLQEIALAVQGGAHYHITVDRSYESYVEHGFVRYVARPFGRRVTIEVELPAR